MEKCRRTKILILFEVKGNRVYAKIEWWMD